MLLQLVRIFVVPDKPPPPRGGCRPTEPPTSVWGLPPPSIRRDFWMATDPKTYVHAHTCARFQVLSKGQILLTIFWSLTRIPKSLFAQIVCWRPGVPRQKKIRIFHKRKNALLALPPLAARPKEHLCSENCVVVGLAYPRPFLFQAAREAA